MAKRIKVSELSEFDATEYLNNEDDVAAYLTTVLEENDPALLAAAIGDIARARGMSQVAKDSGIAREALYKSSSTRQRTAFRNNQPRLRGIRCSLSGAADTFSELTEFSGDSSTRPLSDQKSRQC